MKCEVIQDLLPSYSDGLTSDESNKLVREHLSDCEVCSQMYHEMKQDLPNTAKGMNDASDQTERKLVKRIKTKMVTVISTLIIAFTLLGFFMGNVLFQEGNPVPVISAIIKLETTGADYVKLSNTPNRYISEANPGSERQSAVIKYMREKGWEFKEQMGSGLIFTKNHDQITISTRQYTKHYYIWSIPR